MSKLNQPFSKRISKQPQNRNRPPLPNKSISLQHLSNEVLYGLLPIGVPLPYIGNTPPENFLLLDGTTIGAIGSGADLEGEQYRTLFNIAKDCSPNTGSEDFDSNDQVTLPDARGRTIAGKDDMGGSAANRITSGQAHGVDGTVLGAAGGVGEHTLTSGEMPTHSHSVPSRTFGSQLGNEAIGEVNGGAANSRTSGNAGSSNPHTNLQPTIIFNMMVRYQ